MKKIRAIVSAMTFLALLSCAGPSVSLYGGSYPAKGQDEIIDVYQTNRPTQEYFEIGKIEVTASDDTWNMQQILLKAREIGADGVIITGRYGSFGTVMPGYGYGMVLSQGYGLVAIAIRYK